MYNVFPMYNVFLFLQLQYINHTSPCHAYGYAT